MTPITLCGFPLSNYYNKVKMALIEKGMPFVEERTQMGDKGPALLAASPLGKVPFIRTPQGPVCESEVIMDYLEHLQPEPRLTPADPFAAAKVRELTTFVDLHLELVARELYGAAFFGGTVSDANKARIEALLVKNIAAFRQLARLSPYLAGDTFTRADCAAYVSLPLVALASKICLGRDLLAAGGVDWKPYIQMLDARDSAQRVTADRKAMQAAMQAAAQQAG